MIKLLLKKTTNVLNQYGEALSYYTAENEYTQIVEALFKKGQGCFNVQNKN
ncbi:MAG: hypothetical protein ACR5KW_02650 [Wolbachia sp.]